MRNIRTKSRRLSEAEESLRRLEDRIQRLEGSWEERKEERTQGPDAPRYYQSGSIHPELDSHRLGW